MDSTSGKSAYPVWHSLEAVQPICVLALRDPLLTLVSQVLLEPQFDRLCRLGRHGRRS